MRRIFILLIAVALVFSCAVSVSAANSTSKIGAFATVSSDGSCQVTITATIRLDTVDEDLYFPVPGDATNITLNGSRVRTSRQGDIRRVKLSGITGKMTGEFTINIHYSLPDTVYRDEDGLLRLRVPLLAGFAYPVEAMEFSVTLPGEIENKPAFSSGYHQTSIEKDLTYSISGATVSGTFQKALKDRETFEMTMMVSERMFPQPIVEVNSNTFGQIAVIVCAGLALLYWCLCMWVTPVFRKYNPHPPTGYNAGEIGCLLALQGFVLQAAEAAQGGGIAGAAKVPLVVERPEGAADARPLLGRQGGDQRGKGTHHHVQRPVGADEVGHPAPGKETPCRFREQERQHAQCLGQAELYRAVGDAEGGGQQRQCGIQRTYNGGAGQLLNGNFAHKKSSHFLFRERLRSGRRTNAAVAALGQGVETCRE